MKSTLKIAFVLALAFSGIQEGIAQNYGAPSTKNFNRCIRSIKATTNVRIRFNNALAYFKFKPSTTQQLTEACYYLSDDHDKFELCKAAYPKIVDKVNFYNIYDSFSTFSNAIRLYHYTEGANGPANNTTVNTTQQNHQQNNQQVKDATFDLLVKKGDNLMVAKRYNAAISVYEQAMALKPSDQLISMKLKDARRTKQDQKDASTKKRVKFDLLIKQGDEYLAAKLFDRAIRTYEEAKTIKPQNKLVRMKIDEANRLKDGHIQETTQVLCSVNEEEFKQIKKSIKDQIFPDRIKSMAKQYISKKCFSTEQYKGIISMLYMDNDKLEIIKYLYEFTSTPEDMHLFRDELAFLSSKREFDKFLLEK